MTYRVASHCAGRRGRKNTLLMTKILEELLATSETEIEITITDDLLLKKMIERRADCEIIDQILTECGYEREHSTITFIDEAGAQPLRSVFDEPYNTGNIDCRS